MKYISAVIKELRTPSDQIQEWYNWCGGQCGHTLLGAICALYFPEHALAVAIALGGVKELTDLYQKFDMRALLDSAFDLSFWTIGAWMFSSPDHKLSGIILLMAFICGIIPRIRKAKVKI